MKFLIAGLGSIGRRHFRNLLALGERDIVLLRTHRSTLPDDQLAGFPVEIDLERALERRPDAVIVSNPTALHLEVAVPAAEAGCHILLEKPIAHDPGGLGQLETALARGGGKLLVGYQFRFHPGLQTAARMLREGAIGRALAARAHWGEYLPDWHPWEDYRQSYSARNDLGGGVILTLSHPIDYLRWLLGEVESVWAFAGKLSDLDIEVEDMAEIALQFTSGSLGAIHLNYIQRPASHWLEIVGVDGVLRWDNADGAVRLRSIEAQEFTVFPPPPEFSRNSLFLEEMRHFIAIIQGLEAPRCTLLDGRRALEIASAALKSAAEGRLIPVAGPA